GDEEGEDEDDEREEERAERARVGGGREEAGGLSAARARAAHRELRVAAPDAGDRHPQVDDVAGPGARLVREPPRTAELVRDRRVDRAQEARRGGGIVGPAGGEGELLERPRVEALADDPDRVDGGACRAGGLDR